MGPSTSWAHHTVLAVGASSDQPLNMPYPAAVSDWEGLVGQRWTDHRWMLGIFRLLEPLLNPIGMTCSNMQALSSCQGSLVDRDK